MPRLSYIFTLYSVICTYTSYLCVSEDFNYDEMSRLSNPDLATLVLSALIDPRGPRGYDKRVRPNYGGRAVDVGITVHVSSISAVSEVEMDYTIDIYLRQFWTDPRLHFNNTLLGKKLTVGIEYINKIWVPDTFFPNEKKSFFHDATTHNSFLYITRYGNITVSQRLTVTAGCPMHLQLFPLDSQECTLLIESYGYSLTDIHYKWNFYHGRSPVSLSPVGSKLPTFNIRRVTFSEGLQTLGTGNYSRLFVHFVLGRQLGFYVIQIYLPASLIVITSWVSFWLSRDATPARVSLGVTTVLTMTTLMTASNSSLPKVSYVKSIDIFMICCFLMVFASLIEFAAVGSFNRRLHKKMGKTMLLNEEMLEMTNLPMAVMGNRANSMRGSLRVQPRSTIQSLLTGRLPGESEDEEGRETLLNMNPSVIDKCSRVLFPSIFAVFNLIYWCTFLYLRKIDV